MKQIKTDRLLEQLKADSAEYGGLETGDYSEAQGDITRLGVGVIVNAANSQTLGCFIPCHMNSWDTIGILEECQEKSLRF